MNLLMTLSDPNRSDFGWLGLTTRNHRCFMFSRLYLYLCKGCRL